MAATCQTTFIYDANDAEDADVAKSASGDGDMPTVSRADGVPGRRAKLLGNWLEKAVAKCKFPRDWGSSHLHNWLEHIGHQLQDFSYKHLS